MFSIFFIRRPVFATVISIVIVLAGLVALGVLPIARYPTMTPPTVTVRCTYPGANAQTVSDTVGAPIEEQVNGVEGMIYMSSVSANDGSYTLTVSFAPGTDLDTANVLTQNRVSIAEAQLPEEVRRQGVTVQKESTDVVMYVAFFSPNDTYDDQFLSNYVNLRIKDELARVRDVSRVQVYGVGKFSMRAWLIPDRLKTLNLAASDVVNAIREQNVQVAAGRIGTAPVPAGTAFEYVINVEGRLVDAKEFEDIVVKTSEDGRTIRVRDVARVELGSDSYSFVSQFRGQPAASTAIYQIPDSNMVEVAEGLKLKLEDLKKSFPQDVDYEIVLDNTDIIHASIAEVVETLFLTLILVVLTVYVFLQNFRATIIPAVTIPVALIGTFAVMLMFGYSINQLTLFGLVLVIGIVVDDAIVVVENCTRWLAEGFSPKEAAEKAMIEVSGPVIATTLVLLSVFVPTMFMPGITGTMFQQFAVTISIATIFSSINALTLSPALCGILLRAQTKEPRGFFRWFNVTLEKSTNAYLGVTRMAIRKAFIGVLVFAGLTFAAINGLGRLPTGFVPQEDEGYCMVNVMLPDGASLERTRAVLDQVNEILGNAPGGKSYLSIAGYSILDGSAAPNTGFCVLSFKHWDERPGEELHQAGIVAYLQKETAKIKDAIVFPIVPPSLPGIGISGGFTYMLQDRGGVGLKMLETVGQEMITDGNAQSGLQGLNTPFRSSVPQLFVDLNRDQVMRTGASLSEAFSTLQVYLGSAYVNDFTMFGRVFKVYVQAEGEYRATAEDIRRLELRGRDGQMIPMGSVAEVKDVLGPQSITRFNLYPSIKIMGGPAEGFSSGQALGIMEDMSAKKLPPSMGFSWSELSFQEKQAGGTAGIFVFAVIMVYLVLAAQYESWSLPFSVCLAVPTALLGAVLGISMMGFDNNVYTQIGIVLLIGLSTKSAILIVEFAKVQRDSGMSVAEAAVSSTKLRFRAVLMTAFSFILGVIPLITASGAGAVSRQVIGTAVFWGMLVATVVSLAAVPMLYYVVQRTAEGTWGKGDEGMTADDAEPKEATDEVVSEESEGGEDEEGAEDEKKD